MLQSFASSRYGVMFMIVIVAVLLGCFIADDYGESIDESYNVRTGLLSLHALRGDPPEEWYRSAGPTGPAYFMLMIVASEAIAPLLPYEMMIDVRHFFFFLTFLGGVFAFYSLCLRFIGKVSAVLASLAFLTQPLLWGHAFINPKDTPFMAIFLIAVALGINMDLSARVMAWAKPPSDLKYEIVRSGGFLIQLLLAGLTLGFLSSMRIVGPFAGTLVGLYHFGHHRLKSIPTLTWYALIGGISSFLTRPYFWHDTKARLMHSLHSVSRFEWSGRVLFQGEMYRTSDLPASYSPLLLLRQITEPILLLALVGMVVAVWKARKGSLDRWGLAMIGLWVLVPLAGIHVLDPVRYGLFRQYLFVLPPLFLLGGIGIDSIQLMAKSKTLMGLVGIIVLAPGILGIYQLHPYEYIYHNVVSGGVREVYQQGELDYWCTSVRESIQYVNENADPGTSLYVSVPAQMIWPYIRGGIRPLEDLSQVVSGPAMALICARNNDDSRLFPEAEVLYRVERSGATLSVVKRLP